MISWLNKKTLILTYKMNKIINNLILNKNSKLIKQKNKLVICNNKLNKSNNNNKFCKKNKMRSK